LDLSTQKKSYHHGDLANTCVVAALELIRTQGFQFSLRDVARQAGVSHGAPYRHFANKEALMAEVATRGFRKFAQALRDGSSAGPLPLRLTGMGRAYIEFAVKHPEYFETIFSSKTQWTESHPELEQVSGQAFEVLLAAMEEACAEGYFEGRSPFDAATYVWSVVHGFAHLVLARGPLENSPFGDLKHQIDSLLGLTAKGGGY
jgi:AcrR family transcriptional regulator